MMDRPRILIVEDNTALAGYISVLLVGLRGLSVETAATVKEAWEKFLKFRPDRAVVDMQLPDGSGAELIHKMKSVRPNMRAVVATGYGDDDAREAARKAGADDFLRKPVTCGDIEKSLEIPLVHEVWEDEQVSE